MRFLILSLALMLPAPGFAQSDFTADDILNHFLEGEAGATRQEAPRTRGISLYDNEDTGSAAQPALPKAAAKSEVKSEPSAFNLMVTFEHNSDRLTRRAQRNVEQFAEALRDPRMVSLRFAVDGHTDASGSADYNMSLSQRRARSVANYLRQLGVDSSRLRVSGYGESRPARPDAYDPANRRVETRLLN